MLAAACGASSCSARSADARLSIRGSDTMVILVQRWAEAFMAEHPETAIEVSGGGSGTGMAALINGTTHVAAVSRPLGARERDNLRSVRGREAVDVPAAIDAVSVYVHRDNPVRVLDLEQLKRMYRGEIRNWSEVGGPDRRVVLYGRESSSGTYEFVLSRVLDGEDFAPDAQTLPGTAAVIHAVSRDPGGIGYGGVGYGEGVVALPLLVDGVPVAPTRDNAVSGRYPLTRRLTLVTAGPPAGLPADFIAFVRSERGQSIVESSGYFPLPPAQGAQGPHERHAGAP